MKPDFGSGWNIWGADSAVHDAGSAPNGAADILAAAGMQQQPADPSPTHAAAIPESVAGKKAPTASESAAFRAAAAAALQAVMQAEEAEMTPRPMAGAVDSGTSSKEESAGAPSAPTSASALAEAAGGGVSSLQERLAASRARVAALKVKRGALQANDL